MTKAERAVYVKTWAFNNPDKVTAAQQRYSASHKEERRVSAARYRAQNPEKVKRYFDSKRSKHLSFLRAIKGTYGLSEQEYLTLVEQQNGKCVICQKAKKLTIDHDHSTGIVRGLLCYRCNSWIAYLEEDRDIADKAKLYLRRFMN